MRRLSISVTLILFAVSLAFAASIGSGSPSAAIQQSFMNAYNRGQFPLLVNPVPPADVRALGTPGLVQEFSLQYRPFRERVRQIINDIRAQEGLPLISA